MLSYNGEIYYDGYRRTSAYEAEKEHNFSEVFQEMSPTTAVLIGLITLCAIYLHLKYSQSIAHKAPAFLTTLGILAKRLPLTDFRAIRRILPDDFALGGDDVPPTDLIDQEQGTCVAIPACRFIDPDRPWRSTPAPKLFGGIGLRSSGQRRVRTNYSAVCWSHWSAFSARRLTYCMATIARLSQASDPRWRR